MPADSTTRAVAGLGLLCVIWVFVYWVWDPSDRVARSTGFVDRPAQTTEIENDPVSQPDPRQATEQAPQQEPAIIDPLNEEPAPGEPDAGIIPPKFRDYTVVEGDTFETIAAKELGTSRLASAIARANPFKDPRRLSPGEIVRVPVDPTNIQGRLLADGPGQEPEPLPPPLPEPEFIEYTIQRGDTLSGISMAFYGSTRYVDYILAANRGTLRSANSIRVGQVIRVPATPPGLASQDEAGTGSVASGE